MKRVMFFAASAVVIATSSLNGWSGQGHRLVGLIAAERLTSQARAEVRRLLDGHTLADVANWADTIRSDQQQTYGWHFLNIPPEASGYDRDRDCPRAAGVAEGSRSDRWRDCAVDRILFWEQRLADLSLDRADRAIALKFLVHFVGDLHQPFHTLGVGRGGNDVHVRVFGDANCAEEGEKPFPCNLHAVWDGRLIARRNLDDRAYVARLQKLIVDKRLGSQPAGTPAQWAEQSWRLAKEALVTPGANIDETYYQRHIAAIDDRIALAGVRLAAVLNRSLATNR
ncbi:MAG TPA: S1/P1 nuclease [Vicinamibacterales bacterium]